MAVCTAAITMPYIHIYICMCVIVVLYGKAAIKVAPRARKDLAFVHICQYDVTMELG